MTVLATTAERINDHFYLGATDDDGGLDSETLTWLTDEVIPGVSRAMERPGLLNSPLEIAQHVWEPLRVRRGARSVTLLKGPLVVDDVRPFEVRYSASRVFTDADTIIASTRYTTSPSGIVVFDEGLVGGAGTMQFSYYAGRCTHLEGGVGPNDINLVDVAPDLVLAATLWVATIYQRRRNIDKEGKSGKGRSTTWVGALQHPPDAVRGLIAPHARNRTVR